MVKASTVVRRAFVVSYSDCTHYLISLESEAGQTELVRDEAGQPLRFRNAWRAQLALHQRGFTEVWLRMHTAYDEMIGNYSSDSPADLHLPRVAID